MISLTVGTIRKTPFITGIVKLRDYDGLQPKTAYHVGRLIDKIESEQRNAQDIFTKIVKKYAKTDGMGKLLEPHGPGSFEVPEDKVPDYQKEYEDFENIKIDIDKKPVAMVEFNNAKLTPGEITALGPVLHCLEAI